MIEYDRVSYDCGCPGQTQGIGEKEGWCDGRIHEVHQRWCVSQQLSGTCKESLIQYWNFSQSTMPNVFFLPIFYGPPFPGIWSLQRPRRRKPLRKSRKRKRKSLRRRQRWPKRPKRMLKTLLRLAKARSARGSDHYIFSLAQVRTAIRWLLNHAILNFLVSLVLYFSCEKRCLRQP